MYFYPAIASIFLFFLRIHVISFFFFSFSIFSQRLLTYKDRGNDERRFRSYNFLNKHPSNLSQSFFFETYKEIHSLEEGKSRNYTSQL